MKTEFNMSKQSKQRANPLFVPSVTSCSNPICVHQRNPRLNQVPVPTDY